MTDVGLSLASINRRCTGFRGDVVGQLIEAPEAPEEQKWADT